MLIFVHICEYLLKDVHCYEFEERRPRAKQESAVCSTQAEVVAQPVCAPHATCSRLTREVSACRHILSLVDQSAANPEPGPSTKGVVQNLASGGQNWLWPALSHARVSEGE
eukprot:3313211-Amphidinium_carterae.1